MIPREIGGGANRETRTSARSVRSAVASARVRGSLLVIVMVLSCRRSTETMPDARPLLARYPIRPHVQWTERRERAGRVTTQRREERWTIVGEATWEVVTIDVATGTPFYRARYSLLKDGLAQTAVLDGAKVVPVEPPRLALPLNTSVGFAWEQSHRVGTQQSRRSCSLVAFAGCNDGIEQRCTTTYGDGRVVEVHNRYCGGIGMVGYSSTTRAVGSDETVRISSEDLVDVAGP